MRVAHRRAHLVLWLAMAVALPATLLLALAQREFRQDEPPQRIAEPR